ncbi:MAG: ABC transporter ATP-binding protein [Ignavibacteriales bacterium]|nr:ABC transporter ATP-binding protein [Ignavibacteriales bacterium]
MNIEFKNVSFHYQDDHEVLDRLSFVVEPGAFLLVIGQNGVGKSTLLKLMNGILKPTFGQVFIGGLDSAQHATSRLAAEVCVTFQNPADQIFAPSVRKEVAFAPRNLKRPNVDQLVSQALSLCSLDSVSSRHPYDLPTPQRRLLTIASAIASGAPFLAFDEPSAGLSQIERNVLERLLEELKRDRRGFIVVSHDLALFLRYASHVLVLSEGRSVFFGTPTKLLEQEGYLRKAGLKLPLPLRLERMAAR